MAKKIEKKEECCPPHHGKHKLVGLGILIVAVLWLLSDLGAIATGIESITWIPIMLIVVLLSKILMHCKK